MEDYERSGIVVAVFSYLSCNHSDALSPNIYIHSTYKQPAESHQTMQASWSDTAYKNTCTTWWFNRSPRIVQCVSIAPCQNADGNALFM